jgi:hypothetical protein
MTGPNDDDFIDGVVGDPLAKYKIRTPAQKTMYDWGRRVRGERRRPEPGPGPAPPGGSAFVRWSLYLGGVGAIGGFCWGIWQAITLPGVHGLGPAVTTVLKWTAIGAGAGTLSLAGLVAAASLGLLWVILLGLGLLLNLLAG